VSASGATTTRPRRKYLKRRDMPTPIYTRRKTGRG
jgi:hypothetical protein